MGAAIAGGVIADVNGGSFVQGFASASIGAAFMYAVSAGVGKLKSHDGGGADSGQEGDGFFKSAWKKLTRWNFEGRTEIDKQFYHLSVDEVKGSRGWDKMEGWQAKEHQNSDAFPELKFVHRKSGAELVFNGADQTIIKSGPLKGTANYINAMPVNDLTFLNSPIFAVRGVGHLLVDWVPAKVLGVERLRNAF